MSSAQESRSKTASRPQSEEKCAENRLRRIKARSPIVNPIAKRLVIKIRPEWGLIVVRIV
jgi:hypothetical protein